LLLPAAEQGTQAGARDQVQAGSRRGPRREARDRNRDPATAR
jgi:hypothetical protein